MQNVCIVAEQQNSRLKMATLNAITFGKQAAKSIGGELVLLVIGNRVASIAEELSGFGASKVYLVEDPGLEHCTAETWGHVVAETVRKCQAKIVGMNSGTMGKDLMPRVAAKLNGGMASDILGFDGVRFIREMWAGSAVAEVEVLTDIKVVTVQGTAFEPAVAEKNRATIEPLSISIPPSKTRFIESLETHSEGPELTEASVVVTGGRGLKAKENFEILRELAELLGGAVGATRGSVDAGWAPNSLQVGQTGKKVAPDLYIAVGLSGAIQHLAGMKNSKTIMAINKDKQAPIFEIADYGLVEDLFKAVPELIKAIKTAHKES